MMNMHKLFLYAAEEENFTKAAKRAFVTQQCLSNNIKQLEKEMNVSLFTRTPHLQITSAGKMLYETLKKIELLERDLETRLELVRSESMGSIHLGINASRGIVLLPDLFKMYQEKYPNVKIAVTMEDNVYLEQMMLDNRLDIFLGVNFQGNEMLDSEIVSKDTPMLLATSGFMDLWARDAIEGDYIFGDIIDLHKYLGLPLVGNRVSSTFSALCERYLAYHDIEYRKSLFVSDYATQIELCGKSLAAAFIPQSILELVERYNKLAGENEKLIAFRLKDFEEAVVLSIVKPKYRQVPKYLKDFIDILKSEIMRKDQYIHSVRGRE